MIREQIANLLSQAVSEAQAKGTLPLTTDLEIIIERPQRPEHGDYASSLPLKLARAARTSPLAIAQTLVAAFPRAELLSRVEAAPPGFINFTLSDQWLSQQVETILAAGDRYGDLDLGHGQGVQVEFVSANPVGPLHIGGGRGAALGDCIANLLAAASYKVEREYYVNDAGARMEAFYKSVYARYLQALGQPAELPTDGYHGDYLIDLANEIKAECGDSFLDMAPSSAIPAIGRVALQKVLARISEDLELMGVRFDRWFSEQSLFEDGTFDQAIQNLRRDNFVAEREGATWFVSSSLGEDKDNVLIRSNGMPTYFATDLSYHYDKFVRRSYDRVIDLWGADHQGHVPRMKAAVEALGIDPQRLTIIIHQLVTLKRGDEIVRMSKRSGDIITLREVVEEVGADACRFFLLSRSADGQMDFDLELAKRHSNENPVYYVQYAHARIASILRYSGDRDFSDGDVSLLRSPYELALIRKMAMLPEVVETAAKLLEPHHLPYYAQALATSFHQFYKHCRVVTKDQELTKARLKLVAAAKIVLAKTLHLMGMTAPEKM